MTEPTSRALTVRTRDLMNCRNRSHVQISRASLELDILNAEGGVVLKLSAEKIVGRHCGVLGATGGGKSWTIATLLNQIKAVGGRVILFDPTGEFADVPSISRHYTFNQAEGGAAIVHFPYQSMTEDDLFALFRPSGQSQGPKLRDAIRSPKLIAAVGGKPVAGVAVENGLVVKRQKRRATYVAALDAHKQQINNSHRAFDVFKPPDQLQNECVWSSDNRNDPANWGDTDNLQLGYCETLVARIRMLTHAPELACLFRTDGTSLVKVLTDFFVNETDDLIRISFRNVRFEHHTREILVNIIGRFLLESARKDTFRNKPMIAILDPSVPRTDGWR